MPGTARSSPASPTSPIATTEGGTAKSCDRRGDREREGDVRAGFVRRQPARRRGKDVQRTGVHAAARLEHGEQEGEPLGGDLVGDPRVEPAAWATSAWISTRNDLDPSLVTVKTTPGTSSCGPAQRHRGVDDLAQPLAHHLEQSHLTGRPEAVLLGSHRRNVPWRSPSMRTTVSTRCSSARGPASSPSFVT